MSEVVFGKPSGAAPSKVVDAEVVEPTTTALATRPKHEVGFAAKEITIKDIILPRLNIVHGVGNLKERFTPGSIVYDQKIEIWTPGALNQDGTIKRAATAPLVMTILHVFPTRFVEKVPGGGRGHIFNTEQEVVAAGGTLDWKEWNAKKGDGMSLYDPLCDVLVAIQRPEHIADDDTIFVFPVEDKKYTLALWGLKASAYNALCKRIWFQSAQMGCLRNHQNPASPNWSAFNWRVSNFLNTKFTQPTWVPTALPGTRNSENFVGFVKSFFAASSQPVETAEEPEETKPATATVTVDGETKPAPGAETVS